MTLDPNLEFTDSTVDPEAVAAAAEAEKAAAKATADATAKDITDLKTDLAGKVKEIEGLKSQTAVLAKLKEVFGEKTEDPKEKFIQDEIRKRIPELDDIAKIKEILPLVLSMLDTTVEEQLSKKVETGQDILRGLMDKAGLEGKDEEALGYVEEAVTREIKGNKELVALWQKGQVKSAVSKAFDKVQAKLFAPIRAGAKRSAVSSIIEGPKASPRGGAPAPADKGGKKVDTSDTSREGIKKIHDAAFDRLQELLDRE